MRVFSRDDVLNATDRKLIFVPIPEWGEDGGVYVRTMTAGERDAWEMREQGTRVPRIRASLVAASACDESGSLIFTPDDVKALQERAAGPMQRIFNAITDLNQVSRTDVGELEKN